MPLFDLPASELADHRSGTRAPADLAAFWEGTLATARAQSSPVRAMKVPTGLTLVDMWDVVFSGYGGDPIGGWYHRPAAVAADLPVVVHYQGYGGGRGLSHQMQPWPLAGYSCFEMDTRGQGSGFSSATHRTRPGPSPPTRGT